VKLGSGLRSHDPADLLGGRTLGTLDDVELHPVSLGEGLEPLAVNHFTVPVVRILYCSLKLRAAPNLT